MSKKKIKNEIIIPAKDKKLTMRLNRFLSNKYAVATIVVLMDLFFFFCWNYIINSFSNISKFLGDTSQWKKYLGLKNILLNIELIKNSDVISVFYIIFTIGIVIYDLLLVFRISTSWSAKNFNVGQKGVTRWTTLEEIREQYKEVPEKDISFPGQGGLIVNRYKDKLYLDDSMTNNLIIGMTRSGKGEMLVFPSIDVYSRAEVKTSMIVTDPKTELYRSSKKTLEERGYDVYLLNLSDPLHSMGYNPLSLIVETYKQKDYASAELLAQTFAFSIFNPEDSIGENKFFDSTACSLLSAMIIAHVEDCLNEDEIENDRRYEIYKTKVEAYESQDDDFKEQIREKYKYIKKNSIDIVVDDDIRYIPSNEMFFCTYKHEKQINMYSIINTFIELANMPVEDTNLTCLDLYFTQRPKMDRAKFKYASIVVAGDKTKGSIYSNMLDKLTVFTYENTAKMTAESDLNMVDIGFGKKPIAVFLGIPDYDKSNHFIATVFIRQAYFCLAKRCGENMKCTRPVKVICDEFGNIPAIESMESIITVCLGRNISFDMYIQAYEQLNKLYSDNAKTIIGNCGNQVYILSDSGDTTEEFSKLIGSETIVDIQRNGKKMSLDKTFIENNTDKPLLNSNQLQELLPGECVIKRVMKRTDLKGNPVVPRPIFNSDEKGTKYKFRYQYLQDTFPDPDEISLNELNKESRNHIKLNERVWDYEITFEHFQNNDLEMVENIKKLKDFEDEKKQVIIKALEKIFGSKFMNDNAVDDISISKLVDMIQNNEFLKDKDKRAILNIFNE